MKIFISKGEELFLDRRRVGNSQPQHAIQTGIDYYEYRRLEQEGPKEHTIKDIPKEATQGDYCTVIRRRLGLSQEEVAAKLGISRRILNRMELDELPNGELFSLMRLLLQEVRE